MFAELPEAHMLKLVLVSKIQLSLTSKNVKKFLDQLNENKFWQCKKIDSKTSSK